MPITQADYDENLKQWEDAVAARDEQIGELKTQASRIHGLERGAADARRMVDAVLRLLAERSLRRSGERRIGELEGELRKCQAELAKLRGEEAAVEQVLAAVGQNGGEEPDAAPEPAAEPADDAGDKPAEA